MSSYVVRTTGSCNDVTRSNARIRIVTENPLLISIQYIRMHSRSGHLHHPLPAVVCHTSARLRSSSSASAATVVAWRNRFLRSEMSKPPVRMQTRRRVTRLNSTAPTYRYRPGQASKWRTALGVVSLGIPFPNAHATSQAMKQNEMSRLFLM